MTEAYDARRLGSWHHLGDAHVVLLAMVAVVGVLFGGVWAALLAMVPIVTRRGFLVLLGLAVAVLATGLGEHALATAVPRHLGPYAGWVRVAADPAQVGSGTRITVEVEGERFDVWLHGPTRAALEVRQAGEWVWMSGRRAPNGKDADRARLRHVVGRFTVEVVGDVLPGSALARAGNRVRSALRRSADTTMAPPDAALFTGLVIGDDVRQPAWMVDQFRTSGLSHLTAVSGQNVAFVLAAAMPLLRRLRPWWRWAATMTLIGWFMAVTRFEPSVLRAGTMAMLAATAFVLGHRPQPIRLVALAVLGLVLFDPFLARSVGFWLSVGATVGVCIVGPWCTARLPGPHWLRLSMGVTLGAQAGVAMPSLLVFHRLPLLSVAANVAAVPVAGFVMLYGLPAGLVSAGLPMALRRLCMTPAVVGTRWTATVASVAAELEPHGAAALVGWLLVAALVGILVLRRGGSRSASRRVPF